MKNLSKLLILSFFCTLLGTFGCKSKEKVTESKTPTAAAQAAKDAVVKEYRNQYVFLHLKEDVSPEKIEKRYKAYGPQPMKPTSRTENNWRATFQMPENKLSELLTKMKNDDDIIKAYPPEFTSKPQNSKNVNGTKTAPIKRK